jgi:uridine kinase
LNGGGPYGMSQNCTIIAIAGGSGSGKSVLAQSIRNLLGPQYCSIISQDSYYHDHSEDFDEDGGAVNFDHPDSIEFTLLAEHISKLKMGKTVEIPNYDFVTHARQNEGCIQSPSEVILVDGILLLSQSEILAQVDASVYIEASEEVRLERRMARDVKYRGREAEGVLAQWRNQVQPMHEIFVEGFAEGADLCIDGTADIEDNARIVIQKLNLAPEQ